MSRFRIGLGLLILLFGICLFSQLRMAAIQKPIAEQVLKAEEYAAREDWLKAAVTAEAAKSAWVKHRTFVSALADHQPLEDIECLFAMLNTYAAQQDGTEFRAACQDLHRRILAVKAAQELDLLSLF